MNINFFVTILYYIFMGQEIFESGFLNDINLTSITAFIFADYLSNIRCHLMLPLNLMKRSIHSLKLKRMR